VSSGVPRIKAVVMCHNTPDTTDELYRRLSGCFDVTVFDSGSDEDKRPGCPSERMPNLYWTGCWLEAMRRWGDCDFLWVLGGDVSLRDEPWVYMRAMTSMQGYNVSIWSPAINGRALDMMSSAKAVGKVWSVYRLEGQAMALSKDMMSMIGRTFPPGNHLGWGVDVWLCWKAWTSGMRNVLDGRVSIGHPEGTGYDVVEAEKLCERYLFGLVGPSWPVDTRTFPGFERFECNVRETTM